jgi:Homeodomain-like domain
MGGAHFCAGLVDGEPPFDAGACCISLSFPGKDFGLEALTSADSAVEALAAEHADFDLNRKLKRAQILLAADVGATDEDIAIGVGVGGSTVYRTKRRFVRAFPACEARRVLDRLEFHYVPKHAKLAQHGRVCCSDDSTVRRGMTASF